MGFVVLSAMINKRHLPNPMVIRVQQLGSRAKDFA